MSILALFATLTLFACVSARKNCCFPDRYSAQTTIKTYRLGSFYEGTGEVYYDYAAGMHAAFINMTIDEYKGIYSLVSTHFDANSGIVYTMTGGICMKQKLDVSWLKETDEPHCIPDKANLLSTLTIGSTGENVVVQRFLQTMYNAQREVVVTKQHCYPVQENFYTGEATEFGHEVQMSTMTTIVNVKLSIADPSVLVLPEICEKAVTPNTLPVDPLKFIPFLTNL